MEISVELTLSPLQNDFEPIIIAFIKKLRASGLKVIENPLSTQVFGEYDQVMEVLQKEMKNALVMMEAGVLYIKLVKSNRADYEPHF
ncbi:MAG: hypothetical protein HKM28_00695 [Flavobacteriaceae bacterium]|nr:hypothetical protein [Flavobacteriaceae bacterium]